MNPILFHLFGLPIYAYGTALALAFLVSIVLAAWHASKHGISPETVVDIALALCIGGFVGGRLLFVVLEWGYYAQHPWQILNTRAGGMSFYGGAILGIYAAWWYGRRKKLDNWRVADLIVPFAPLGYAIARVGCLLRGCCFGIPTHVPWALACAEGDLTLRHPTQIYAMIGSLIIFVILFLLRNHKRFPGFLLFLYIGLYAIMRGIIEAFRDDPTVFHTEIRLTQLACFIILLVAVFGIWFGERKRLRNLKPGVQSGEEMGRGTGTGPAAP